MGQGIIDILMVTYNRLEYTQRSLPRLLDSCDESMRVWVWHNGNDAATLELVRSLESHPRMHRIHHCPENKRLREPTNWFWANSDGDYVSKIDDDNLMPDGWGDKLRGAHEAEPKVGAIACWGFMPDDVLPELVNRKLRDLGNGHRIMRNAWVAGTGHVMKRACVQQMGPIAENQTFTMWCVRLAVAGWINGFYHPFIFMENMDDPRSAYTRLKSESDFQENKSLSADRFGIQSLQQFRDRQRVLAMEIQRAHPDARRFVGWRRKLRQVAHLITRADRRPTPRWT